MAVGRFSPNAWGVFDMHGNVAEWCLDWYSPKYDKEKSLAPTGPESGEYRVVRDGSWDKSPSTCRSSSRDKLEPRRSSRSVGFRVVMEERSRPLAAAGPSPDKIAGPEETSTIAALEKWESEDRLTCSWKEAVEFCRMASKKTGRTFRLPTEAEWEYACRAGTTTLFHTGDTSEHFYSHDTPIGHFPPNAWGLYDLHGGEHEWCADWYGEYDLSSTVDPTGPTGGVGRVIRDGTGPNRTPWRSAEREFGTGTAGFRVVVE